MVGCLLSLPLSKKYGNMDIDIITSGIISIATTGVGYLFGRRKNNADAASQEIANVSKLFEVYDKAIDDIKAQVNEMSKERTDLYKRVGDLNLKVASLMKFSCVNMACKQRLTDLSVLNSESKELKKE